MRLKTFALLLLLSLGCSVSALADSFHLTFTDRGGTADLLLSGNSVSQGKYLITSASGHIEGSTVSLLSPGSYPAASSPNDNNLFSSLTTAQPTYFDYKGISFALSDGSYFNLYADGSTYDAITGTCSSNGVRILISALSMTLVPSSSGTPAAVTPEPSSLPLLGTGVLGAAGALRRRVLA